MWSLSHRLARFLVRFAPKTAPYHQLLACFVISYPLGSLFLLIPKDRPALKHAYNIGVSLFFLLGMLHLWAGMLHVVGGAMVTYILASLMRGRAMPWTVFA